MKANELMIGDWMLDKAVSDKPVQIEQINEQNVHYKCGKGYMSAGVELLEQVPLEKIHLVKNGFKAREETDDTEFYYYDCYEINVSFDEGISDENIPPIIFLTIEFAEKSIAMPIEYVHELQQAMRIMGCDKEIEL